MRIKIISRKEEPLLHREKVLFEVEEIKNTPSRKELREKVAAQLNANAELIIIDRLEHHFGRHAIMATAKIYKTKEDLKKFTIKPIIERNFPSEKKEKKEGTEKATSKAT